MPLTARQRKLLMWVGYPVLALVSFWIALVFTFPYDRVRDKVVEMASSKYDVDIGDLRLSLIPGGLVMRDVTLSTRPEKPDEVPAMLYFETIDVDTSILGLLTKNYSVEVDAETPDGSLEAELDFDKSEGLSIRAETVAFPLGSLPGVRRAAGMPIDGALNAKLELTLPDNKFDQAEGRFEFSCDNCSVGDGETKVKARATEAQIARWKRQGRWKQKKVLLEQGMVVPRLSLGAAQGRVVIEKGIGRIEEFAAVSPDGQVQLSGDLDFNDPMIKSTMDACIKWKLSDDLKKREKDFGNVEFLFATKKGEDGFISFPMQGTFKVLRWRTKRDCKKPGDKKDGRPTISRKTPRPTPSRTPRTSTSDPITRRAAGKDVEEPETDGPGKSGPALAAPPSKDQEDDDKANRRRPEALSPAGRRGDDRKDDDRRDDDGDDRDFDDEGEGDVEEDEEEFDDEGDRAPID